MMSSVIKQLRAILFWCHLITGVSVGVVVLVMSATGALLAYERQIVHWTDVRGLNAATPAGAQALTVDAIVARVGTVPMSMTWRADAPRLVEISPTRDQLLYVDAFTGDVLRRGDPGVRAFFARVRDWHRWLGASGSDPASRGRGRAITGVANVGFLFLVLSGFWLWWPRNWTREAFRALVFFRRRLRAKARDFNWHHVIGIWSLVPLFVIVFSGVVMSYAWANALLYRTFGDKPPTAPAPPAGGQRAQSASHTPDAPTVPARIDAMLASAKQKSPDWRSITVTIPRTPSAPVSFAIDRGTGGEPHKRATLTLDPVTGAEQRWQTFASLSAGQRARAVVRFGHTGEILGVLGQTIAGLVSLGAMVMVWTGISLAIRRLAAWRRRGTAGERDMPDSATSPRARSA